MSATGWNKTGSMGFHPYKYKTWVKIAKKQGYDMNKVSKISGGWVHNPIWLATDAVKGASLGTAIGTGNFLTRNYRQKPLVGLTTATHRKDPVKVLRDKVYMKIKPTPVAVSTVSARRTKSYPKKILHTTKAMPYKRSRRTYRRKAHKGRPRRRRHRKLPPLALPRSRIVRMRLVGRTSLAGAGGAINTAMLKMNSLNDPSGGFGTGLPLGLDQWAAQYQKYIVLGSKVKARFIPTAITGAGNVGLHIDDDNTALANAAHYKELPNTVNRIVTTQKDFATATINYSGKRFWRLSNIKDDSEQEGAFSTTPGDPTDICYCHVYVEDMTGANNFTCDVQVEMEFIVYLTEPVTLAQSSL